MKWEWIDVEVYRLRAPEGFLESKFLNRGCGPGEFGDKLVPDSILGLSLQICCAIHDYSYSIGETKEEKTNADIELFANGFRIIKQGSNKLTMLPRAIILTVYFLAVVYGGNSAFNGD
jgi:hypothetical protein